MNKKIYRLLFVMVLVFAVTGLAGCVVTEVDEAMADNEQIQEVEAQVESEQDKSDGEVIDYGAWGALSAEDWDIEQMLEYAIQDEYLARQEYEMIMEAYDVDRPFSNIIRAEETHIALLKDIYASYGYDIPEDRAIEYAVLPDSLEDAYTIGVEAEINNIAMYNMFLEKDLPSDIAAVFTELRDGSENHLASFKRGVRGTGNGANN